MLLFFNMRSTKVSKHSKLAKRQTRDRYGRFTSPSSRTTPPSSDDSSVELWEVPPPPLTRLGESSSGYNDKCPHVKEVSSYELLLDLSII
jgi:hypothetical protein